MKNNKYQIKDISDEEIYEAIKKSKEHYRAKGCPFISVNPMFPYDYLKYPDKLVLAKMDKMSDEGKLEYGVSLRTAWIAEK